MGGLAVQNDDPGEGPSGAAARLAALGPRYGALDGAGLLTPLIREEFPGRIALVSSFGAEAAVLLHMVAAIDPSVPVLFIDTDKHFGETLRYRDRLVAELGLTDLRVLQPDAEALAAADPDGTLWARDPDTCCALRKVAPLARGLEGFDAWISGRKRFQSATRAELPTLEVADGRIKVNPLARWLPGDLEQARLAHGLPAHPLVADGYLSIGCMPCTDRAAPGDDARSGRWRGTDKTECGIHLPAYAVSVQRTDR